MKGMIYAVSPQGIIGVGGKIPWRYLGDWKRFKRVTMGSTVVMGRTTFESIGRPLPGRRNIVVTSRPLDVPGVECVTSVEQALARAGAADVWFIGGARIYKDAMKYVEVIDVTYVPDYVDGWDAVRAPVIDDGEFVAGPLLQHEDEPALKRQVYTRRRA
ncbi:MAG TPA: dihydrofolate reductase [Polyangiaceae bacterium]|nr:dihydrofolate reductase [Polyangiaceae bacterium]